MNGTSPLDLDGSARAPIVVDIQDECIAMTKRDHEASQSSSSRYTGSNPPSPKRSRGASKSKMAPIKLYRTIQMEESPSAHSKQVRENTTTLRELLLDGCKRTIEWIVISNYLIDFALLLAEVPELISVNLVLCFYGNCLEEASLRQWKDQCRKADGSTRIHPVRLDPSDTPRSPSNPLDRKIPFGVHHSKFFLIGYSDKTLRVVIHTANLVYGDLHLKADAAFLQDFPMKQPGVETSTFERDLVTYLQSYRYNTQHSWETTSAPITMNQLMARYDFSTAKAVLIPSIPGYHRGEDICTFGHMKLRKTIRDNCTAQCDDAAVVCQFSSMGSLNEKWLQKEFGASTTGTEANVPIRLVFPTAEEVRNSVEGYSGGASLPADSKNVEKPFLRSLYRRWTTQQDNLNPFALNRNLPHIKTFFRYDSTGRGMQWFLLSSHNISSAAWGQLQKKGQQFFVRHWELGVFLSPKTLSCEQLRPLKNTEDYGTGDMTLPLPFNFYPEAYADGDIPWAWDKTYRKSDQFGRFGLR